MLLSCCTSSLPEVPSWIMRNPLVNVAANLDPSVFQARALMGVPPHCKNRLQGGADGRQVEPSFVGQARPVAGEREDPHGQVRFYLSALAAAVEEAIQAAVGKAP
jgi:hypothetical protein